MLPQLRRTIQELVQSSARSFPRGVRAFASLDQSGSDNVDGPHVESSSQEASSSSLPQPAQYPATPSPQTYYTSASSSTAPPPILDIPPESDPLLAYLTSHLMRDGKRHAAAQRTSRTLLHLHALTRSPPLPILRSAVLLAAPSIRIVSHKKGGKNVQKPIPLGEKQRTRFAIKWMLAAAEKRSGKQIEERFAREVLAIIKGDSEVLKKKSDVHKLAMVNRANAKVRV